MVGYINTPLKFEDIYRVIRIRKSQNDRQHNDKKKKRQNNKQRSTKHYAKIKTSTNTNPTKKRR